MEGRGKSRRRNTRQEWKRRLSSALAVVLTAAMVLNMPLSIDSLGLHVSNAFASGSNADREGGLWATASNAKYQKGQSQDVDIYVIAEDNEAAPGNTSSMTLYLKNNTGQTITEGTLSFKGNHIAKEDGYFEDMGTAQADTPTVIVGGEDPTKQTEASGEGMLYQEDGEDSKESIDGEASLGDQDGIAGGDDADADANDADDEDADDEDAEEEESHKLTDIDLQPGEMREIRFTYYTDDEENSTKAYVEFSFHGEDENEAAVRSSSKFYYSIGLPFVNFSMEDGMQIESGVSNDMEIWMSEPTWVDEALEERIEKQEEEEAEKAYKDEETEPADTASGSNADKASDSNASKDTEDADTQKDQDKINQYKEEAMTISKVSYDVEIYGAELERFSPRKAEEVEDLGWISCIYEVANNTEPGVYYGKVTANGRWNNRKFTSEQGFLFEVTGEGKTGQEFTKELDKVIVHAYAEEGVLEEGVKLTVEELAKGSEPFSRATEGLDNGDVQYDENNMLAFDICFVNKNGEEVEPNGDVQVSIEMKKDALPEDIDLETVEVHHIKEFDDTVEAEPVADGADKTDGTVKSAEVAVAELKEAEVDQEEIEAAVSDEAVAVAEFSVGSFSYFTITWGKWSSSQKVNVYLLDDNYKELSEEGEHLEKFDITVNNNDTVVLSEKAPYIHNYTYQKAVIASSKEDVDNRSQTVYRLRYSGREWQYSQNNNSGWQNLGSKNIYLIYSEDDTESAGGDGGSIETELPEPSISKTAISNGDGTYNLNLSVTGSVGSQSSTVNVDVLMIVDESNSMSDSKLFTPLKEAMRSLIDTLERKEGVDARYGIVSFATTPQKELNEWTSMGDYDPDAGNADVQFRRSKVGGVISSGIGKRTDSNDGGTNYMAGFRAAESLLNSSNSDKERNAITVIVFLSDGDPTFYYPSHTSNTSTGYYTGPVWNQTNSPLETDSWRWRLTLEEADDLVCDQFYSVGIGNASESYLHTNDELGGLVDAVNASGIAKYVNAGTNGENLSQEFANIAGSVTDLYIENVTITDTVNTQNVEQVAGTGLSIKVTNEKGVDVTSTEVSEGKITAQYENDVLSLDFDDGYGLKPGYTYTVTMKIQPTSDAEIYYAKNEEYPEGQQADSNTGTHSDKKGFFSNQKAELSFYYTDNDKVQGEQKLVYPMPVVQVQKGYLKLSKIMADNSFAGTDSFKFLLSIPAEYAATYNAFYSTDTSGRGTTLAFAANGDKAEAEIVLNATEYVIIALPDGVSVNISETTNGYTPSWSVDGTNNSGQSVSVSISKGEFTDVICTNTVKISIPTGLYDDRRPYMLMLAGAVIILAGYGANMYSRRRREK